MLSVNNLSVVGVHVCWRLCVLKPPVSLNIHTPGNNLSNEYIYVNNYVCIFGICLQHIIMTTGWARWLFKNYSCRSFCTSEPNFKRIVIIWFRFGTLAGTLKIGCWPLSLRYDEHDNWTKGSNGTRVNGRSVSYSSPSVPPSIGHCWTFSVL